MDRPSLGATGGGSGLATVPERRDGPALTRKVPIMGHALGGPATYHRFSRDSYPPLGGRCEAAVRAGRVGRQRRRKGVGSGRAPGEERRVRAATGGKGTTMADQPNILILWGDGIGIWTISQFSRGMMGYWTPGIDRLAEEGVTFTD